MRRSIPLAAPVGVVVLLLLVGTVRAQPEDPPAKCTFRTIAAETGAGLGGGVLIGGGVGLVGVLAVSALGTQYEAPESRGLEDLSGVLSAGAATAAGGIVLALTGAAAVVAYNCGCGAGVSWAGTRMQQGGRLSAAVCGSFAGAAAAVGTGLLVRRVEAFVAGGLVLCPAGAVIGYNLSRPKPDIWSSTEGRLEWPSLAMRQERLPDRSGLTVYDARLVTVRF